MHYRAEIAPSHMHSGSKGRRNKPLNTWRSGYRPIPGTLYQVPDQLSSLDTWPLEPAQEHATAWYCAVARGERSGSMRCKCLTAGTCIRGSQWWDDGKNHTHACLGYPCERRQQASLYKVTPGPWHVAMSPLVEKQSEVNADIRF